MMAASFVRRPVGAAGSVALVLLLALGTSVQAGPFETCLGGAGDAGAGLAACRSAEAILVLSGRDTKRSNIASNPALPPAVRANRTRLADLSLARARYLADLGDLDGARAALRKARDVNPSARGVEEVVVMLDQGSFPGSSVQPAAGPKAAAPASAPAETFTLQFDRDSAALREDGRRLLDALAAVMTRDGTLASRLRIAGHADSSGPASHNLDLSLRRARTVAAYLIDAHRLRADRMSVEGLGESQPLPGRPGDDPANRRVEVTRLPTDEPAVSSLR